MESYPTNSDQIKREHRLANAKARSNEKASFQRSGSARRSNEREAQANWQHLKPVRAAGAPSGVGQGRRGPEWAG